MAPDIASRIKSKLLRRRHSAAPSFVSSRSVASSIETASSAHQQSPNKPSSAVGQSQSQSQSQQHRETSGLSAASRTDDSSVRVITPSPGKTDEESAAEQKEAEAQVVVENSSGASSEQDDGLLAATSTGKVGPNESDPPANASTSSDRQRPEPPSPTNASSSLQQQPQQQRTTQSQSQPQPQGRLHSIDEGSDPTAPNKTARTEHHHNHDHNLHIQVHHHDHSHEPSDLPSSISRDKRPGPLDFSSSNNHTHHTHLAVDSPSLAHTPSYYQRNPLPRRQSLISNRQTSLIKTLLHGPPTHDPDDDAPDLDTVEMVTTRKIWVKRPHASPTLVTINEDDLVDDVRDMILRKYANSLGRTFDSPDLTLRICPRDQSQKERFLGPEEHMARTVDSHFPGGQSVEEALVIDIPRRTPKPSPRPTGIYITEDGRPPETAEGYFPPVGGPSPHQQPAATAPAPAPHSISVLGTGHIAPVPSPGGTRRFHRERSSRPGIQRTHTTSPNVIANGPQAAPSSDASHGMQHYVHRPSHSRAHSNASDQKNASQATGPPMPTSPVNQTSQGRVATPPPRVSSPRPSATRIKKAKKPSEYSTLNGAPGVLGGSVPPISVLIVEDNPINLKLLEAFVKKLKVRWQTAMNGRDAVKKWRNGGFHLVLMDIQLPIMSGLDATREIRRLERLNSIGVFSSTSNGLPEKEEEDSSGEISEKDRLENISLFKSPVIIVALTASSLQSDRHEALAAGCNDFLTKVRH